MNSTAVFITDTRFVSKRNCHKDRTVNEVYEATERKTEMLRRAGYQVVGKWECEFKEEKKTDAQLKAFLESFELVTPLEPRDAFYGGRTGATTLHAKANEAVGEQILYADVTSLYLYVNKYKEYPVRFPLIYTNPADQDIHHYSGVAKVDILSPERLFHPKWEVLGLLSKYRKLCLWGTGCWRFTKSGIFEKAWRTLLVYIAKNLTSFGLALMKLLKLKSHRYLARSLSL